MDCLMEFCVYQNNGKCILDKISLNNIGQCEDMIYIDIDTELLEKLKEKQLSRYSD